jgi:hypothetical protein
MVATMSDFENIIKMSIKHQKQRSRSIVRKSLQNNDLQWQIYLTLYEYFAIIVVYLMINN